MRRATNSRGDLTSHVVARTRGRPLMRAKRVRPSASPRLEPLEARLAPAARLEPLADNPERYTLRIDLGQHPRGGDGLPDAVLVSLAGGVLEVSLVGRVPDVLYRDEAGVVDR